MSTEFTCKVCKAKHISVKKNEYGLDLLPDTITTRRNSKLEWFLCCVECPQASSVPTGHSLSLWLRLAALWEQCIWHLKFTWNALTHRFKI